MRWTTAAAFLCWAWVVGCTPADEERAEDDSDTDTDTDTDADSDTDSDTDSAPIDATSVDPRIVDPLGGSHLILRGVGFAATSEHAAVDRVSVGGAVASELLIVSDSELWFVTAPVESGSGLDLVVERGDVQATLSDALEAWSPAELEGARLFDADWGVTTEEARTTYEWQRLTAEIGTDWRVRDGNTLTWLPSVSKLVMVGGWNGYEEPDGFSPVPAHSTYPPLNTTDEVWSSPDGVSWTLELPHGNGAFERRHAHNTVLWNGKLWMIGGDAHQGYYNHDVVSSADGVSWTVELGPGTDDPPWSERALQTIGVYDNKLWMAGGQDLLGDPAKYAYHNDVWNTEDGVHWTQVVADAPASATRWGGCGSLDGLVEFQGELWLVGCAREREDAKGHSMWNEVWSTTDGLSWTLHAEPPWVGKIWPNVVVWDDRLWILFGFTYGDPANGWPAGNANEAWYSEDGETWTSLPADSPVPGSHAQGVAATEDFLLLAGGNYSFGFGAGVDKSVWRLVPYRGSAVRSWTDRGADALVVSALDDGARPLLVPDAFGNGIGGLQFDGSTSVLALESGVDEQAAGRSIFWVARAPYLPPPWGWVEDYAPLGTLVGGPIDYGWMPRSSVGLSGGQVVLLNLDDDLGKHGEPRWTRIAGAAGLQEGPGTARMAGLTHSAEGTARVWVDGVAEDETASADYGSPRAWSRIGGGLDDAYYGPHTRFAGSLGAVIVLPDAADAETVERIHQWARGRFQVP